MADKQEIATAWKTKAATHAAIQRAKDDLKKANLAKKPMEEIEARDADLQTAIDKDKAALIEVAKASGYEPDLF